MKLTADQIDVLYKFTRQHFVEWYDLQSELVDHLANAIEDAIEENPKLSFDDALNNEFKKFGIFGFMDVVEERRLFLGKKYRKIIWDYYRNFFKLPRVLLLFFVAYVIFSVSKFIQDTQGLYFCLFLGIALFSLVKIFKVNKAMKEREKLTGKKWLFEETARTLDVFSIGVLPIQFINLSNAFIVENSWNQWQALVGAILLVLFALLIYIQWKILPKKISEELSKVYKEYQISK